MDWSWYSFTLGFVACFALYTEVLILLARLEAKELKKERDNLFARLQAIEDAE